MGELPIYSGCGNTFLLTETLLSSPIERLCTEADVDGLVVLQAQRMRIFNRDGKEAAMCGNATRVALAHLGLDRVTLQTSWGPVDVIKKGNLFGTNMFITPNIRSTPHGVWMNTGVPHLVIEGEKDLEKEGPFLRHHPLFAKEGVNVTSFTREGKILRCQTYERGVERVTAACGTGAIAAGIAAAGEQSFGQYTIYPPSNEPLRLDWEKNWEKKGKKWRVTLWGPAKHVGNFRIERMCL